MQSALRPYVTAGVAVVGAGLISVVPAVAPDVEQRLEQRAVELMATTYPVYTYGDLLTNTATNLERIGQEIAAKPFPFLEQFVSNQMTYAQDIAAGLQGAVNGLVEQLQGLPATLQTAWGQLMDGQVFTAVQTVETYVLLDTILLKVGLPLVEKLIPIFKSVGSNLDSIVSTGLPQVLVYQLAATYPLITGPINASAGVIQNIVTDMGSGDYQGVLTNVVLGLPTIMNALLNGYPEGYFSPGVLGVGGSVEDILTLRNDFAGFITPASALARAAVAAVDPSVSANLSAAAADISAVLNPAAWSADLSTVLNPADLAAAFGSALSSIGDIPALLTSLIP